MCHVVWYVMGSSQKQNVIRRKKADDIHLDISVTNFGPIREGKIRIKPLTIFMGSNNSGKSYMAVLIHSILEGHRGIAEAVSNAVTPKHISHIRQKSHDRQNAKSDITIPLDFESVGKTICENISKNFSAELSSLVKIGDNLCSMDIVTDITKTKILLTKEQTKCHTTNTNDMGLRVGIRQKNEKTTYEKDGIINIKYTERGKDPESLSYNINNRLLNQVLKKIPPTLYIPPSRYGVVQAQQVLAAGLLDYVPYAGTSRFVIPEISGTVGNFLRTLLQLPYDNTAQKNSKIIKDLEMSILDGKIQTDSSSWKMTKKMTYTHQNVAMPLHMASSSVSEMISLVLYLRHYVRPGCLLIVEEPESHLDPQNQLHLARCIANLIRVGVNVLITTHSPYMVEQLGNYVQVGGLEDRRAINVGKDDYILPDEIAVYDFERDDDGVVVKPADVSTIDGITQRLFIDAFEKINELSYSVDKAHGF